MHPLLGHGIILVVLVASIGVTRSVVVAPRDREVRSLRADEQRLRARLVELTTGLGDLNAWTAAHPGEDLHAFHARRPLPEGEMVPSFLRAVAPLADRHRIATERIRPLGVVADETVTDASGRAVTYRRAELRFRVQGAYRDLGGYLRDIEALEQLVVVRSVAIQRRQPAAPVLAADVTFWIYGTP